MGGLHSAVGSWPEGRLPAWVLRLACLVPPCLMLQQAEPLFSCTMAAHAPAGPGPLLGRVWEVRSLTCACTALSLGAAPQNYGRSWINNTRAAGIDYFLIGALDECG